MIAFINVLWAIGLITLGAVIAWLMNYRRWRTEEDEFQSLLDETKHLREQYRKALEDFCNDREHV